MAESVQFQKLSLVRFLIARWACSEMSTSSDWNGTLKNIGSLRAYKKSRLLFYLEIRYRTHDIIQIVKSLTATPTPLEKKSNQITNLNHSTRQNSRNWTFRRACLQKQLKFAQNKRKKDHWTSNFHACRYVWRVIAKLCKVGTLLMWQKNTWMKLTDLHVKAFSKEKQWRPHGRSWAFTCTLIRRSFQLIC